AQKARLTVTFKHLGKKARKQYFDERLGKEDDAEILSGIIVGWEGADTRTRARRSSRCSITTSWPPPRSCAPTARH
ncbi:hypothetical protein, partial [Dentiradicibacter hellwigii]